MRASKSPSSGRQNLKVTYKQPAGPSPSGLGAGNYDEDLPEIPDMDQDGYCVNERGKKFIRVEHEHKQGKFETPENQYDPVQEASEVTGTETTTLTTDIRKRQVHAKSKHKGLFENPDGSSIDTYTEFKDSQVRFLKDKSDSKYVSDCILIGEGSEPKDAACVIDDKTQDCLVL